MGNIDDKATLDDFTRQVIDRYGHVDIIEFDDSIAPAIMDHILSFFAKGKTNV